MRKQLHRVKQFADQTFYKAEKTEPLTDDMQTADKHAEQIRAALVGLNKRLGNSKTSESNSQDKEKRVKKCPEYVLGQTMLENAGVEGPMSYTLKSCGKAQIALANEIVDHESKVDQYVTTPLQQILDADIPNILRHKKSLQRAILDMDSVKSRYHHAMKHNIGGATATKVDSLKDELEDAETKVESNRDLLASDLFQLMSKETQLAQTILLYIKLQRAYHESALHCLEDVIPDLESFINNNDMKPVYNYSLEEHLRVTNRKIALPIQLCVCALLRIGMEEEGLFRVAGSTSKLKRLKLSLDACCLNLRMALEYRDPHVIAGALKSYLRDLPDPLLTYELYYEWMAATRQTPLETRLATFHAIIQKLPQINYENLRFLIKFFAEFTKRQDVNKMSPHNLAIVVAPNLIWAPLTDTTTAAMDAANYSSLIMEDLITYADYFFPGEIDFDRDLESMIVELTDSETSSSNAVGMRRCMSNNSLNDLGDNSTQSSPKPTARRKNKPAPTPPSGNTPDKHQQQHIQTVAPHHEFKRPDEKPPPAPDKPPRPLVTATLNRTTYKAQKHDQVTAELIQLQPPSGQAQTPSPSHATQQQMQMPLQPQSQPQDSTSNNKAVQSDKSLHNSGRSLEDDAQPVGFDANKAESIKDIQNSTDTSPHQQTESSPTDHMNNHKIDSKEDKVNADLIGFEALCLKTAESTMDDAKPLNDSAAISGSMEKLDSPKLKPIPTEKPVPTTLERRKPPVATPRYLTNANTTATNQQEDFVEMRKKLDGNNINPADRISKPAIPERPAGLARPSSLIRGFPRHSTENLDSDSGPLTLERTQVYSMDKQQVSIVQVRDASETNGASSTINLQRSPSVGSRPASMAISAPSAAALQQPFYEQRPDKPPPRPEPPAADHVRAHSRTRSEGNIIDVQTQTQTVVVPRPSSQQQHQSTSPRFYQRPPRPQPPPPPPPLAARPKSDNESTNL